MPILKLPWPSPRSRVGSQIRHRSTSVCLCTRHHPPVSCLAEAQWRPPPSRAILVGRCRRRVKLLAGPGTPSRGRNFDARRLASALPERSGSNRQPVRTQRWAPAIAARTACGGDERQHMLRASPDMGMEVLEARDLGDLTLTATRIRGHGAGRDVLVEQTLWRVIEWRDGECLVGRLHKRAQRGRSRRAAGIAGRIRGTSHSRRSE